MDVSCINPSAIQAAKVVLIDDEAAAKSRSEHEARLFSWLSRNNPEKLSKMARERERKPYYLFVCTYKLSIFVFIQKTKCKKKIIQWKWIVNQHWEY